MKITQRIIGAILGLSLAGGVATGVFLSPQNHDIEETNAADEVTEVQPGMVLKEGTAIYVSSKGDIDITVNGATLQAWVWYLNGGSHWEVFQKDHLTDKYFITLDSDANGLTFARTKNAPPEENYKTFEYAGIGNNDSNPYNQCDMRFEEGKNLIYPTDWGNSTNSITCTWKTVNFKLVGDKLNNWTESNNDFLMSRPDYYQAFIRIKLEKDTLFKILVTLQDSTTTWYKWYSATDLETNVNSNLICDDGGNDHNIKILVTGTYNIYLKHDSEQKKNTIWIANVPDIDAKEFATTFINKTKTICEEIDFSTHEESLKTIWNMVSSGDGTLEDLYAQMTIYAQAQFNAQQKDGDGNLINEDPIITSARERYIYIISKYNTLNDFARLRTVNNSNFLRSMTDNNNVALITIVALISSAAIASYSFLKIRRKKEY